MCYRQQIINKTNIAAKSVLKSCIVVFLSTEKEITGSFFQFLLVKWKTFLWHVLHVAFFILLGAQINNYVLTTAIYLNIPYLTFNLTSYSFQT